MGKLTLGVLTGLGLGLIDGASAAFNPEAQSMLAAIVASATIKGALTGGLAGYIARRIDGIPRNVLTGSAIGFVLSVLAAIPANTYVEIIVPGVIIGVLVGFIVGKYGR